MHAALQAYNWPGNIRELENTMERATVMAGPDETEVVLRHLPPKLRSAA
jgi:transcriptional regulator with PAS, ATPase and Fis domain